MARRVVECLRSLKSHGRQTARSTPHQTPIQFLCQSHPFVLYSNRLSPTKLLITSFSTDFSQPQSWVTKIPSTSPSLLSRLSVTKVSIHRAQCALHTILKLDLEMVENMKSVASEDQELSVEERNLLSVAYKNVIGARRASWRIVTSIEQKEESKGNSTQVTLIKEYRQKIEAELAKICEDILEVLDKHLIPSAKSGESKVFYHKMFVCPLYPLLATNSNCFAGREITTVTSLSSPLATSERSLPTSLLRPTRTPPRLHRLISHQHTQSALVSPLTSPSSTMRS